VGVSAFLDLQFCNDSIPHYLADVRNNNINPYKGKGKGKAIPLQALTGP
jgi:hypothetical protein